MPKQPPSAQVLIANYQTVFVSQATVDAAHYEADRSENELLAHLRSSGGGGYLQPGRIEGQEDVMTRASLDAHIKKVQVEQLDNMNAGQLFELQQTSQAMFAGRKVDIVVRMPAKQPVETVWFDQQNGYRTSVNKKLRYSGVIEEILLDKNALILRPSGFGRLLNSSLQNYVVYIIDPDSYQPMVDISFR